MIIPEEWWKKYEEKYGKLMYTIARKLGGDPMIASIEDNYNELCIAAIDSVNSFYNQRGQTNKDLDSYLSSKAFDQYTKTVLWNRKAKNGEEITKKLGITNASSMSYSTEEDLVIDFEDTTDYFSYTDMKDLLSSKKLNKNIEGEEIKKIIQQIISGGDCVLDSGKLSVRKLALNLGIKYRIANKRVAKLKEFINKEIKYED